MVNRPVLVTEGLATAAEHRASALHGQDFGWVEKNCYLDLWIELLQACGLEPRACLAFLPTLDFEADQWTFLKPPLADLRALYGIEVQELTVWRPLLDHALEHLGAGKWLAVEVDAFWLPDTAGTDYRSAHTKTTVVFNEIDADTRRLGYFHNAGYFALAGDDFEGVFGVRSATPQLPPYVESIRLDRLVRLDDHTLRRLSGRLLDEHLAWRPRSNPVRRYAGRFDTDLQTLQQAGLASYHRWAFAGLRQLGAGSELAAHHLRWLAPDDPAAMTTAAHFERLSTQARALMLKAARVVHSGRALDARDLLADMADAWDRGIGGLVERSSRSER